MKKINSTIEIHASKKKTLLRMLVCLGFVLLSIWICSPDSQGRNAALENILAGILGLVIFGFGFVVFLISLFDKRPNLTISESGINFKSIGGKICIPWGNISRIDTQTIKTKVFILIFMNNTEEFIQSQKKFNQEIMRRTIKLCNAPVAFSNTVLDIEFDALCKLMSEQFELNKHSVLDPL
jgi:hypothetical protein